MDTPPVYREFHFQVQVSSDIVEVLGLIGQILTSYPTVPGVLVGTLLTDIAACPTYPRYARAKTT